ncbi:MAG TPA: hypothetical protein DEQ80_08270 [Anaerolinea thermolimosa]|uniref:Thymidylate kinase-like domain-containing protein n=1 Tax=Anaerolinea thermolimosa TaxID=229919 RepID=A0A3D1JGW9_9CHLR|nr:hypothetical protein [Anaerolinea thermolimosa]
MSKLIYDPYLFQQIFQTLDREKIPYVIAHGYDHFPEEITSDVDVIVTPEGLYRLPEILSSLGLTQWIQHEATAHFFILTASPQNGKIPFLQFDVSSDFRRDGLILLTAEEFFSGRKRFKDAFWVPSADVEFAYYLSKKIGKQILTQEHAARLKRLFHKAPEQCVAWIERFFPLEWRDVIILASSSGNWSGLDLSVVKEEMIGYLSSKEKWRTRQYRWFEQTRRLKRVIKPTGLFVQVIGLDGSGKTTLIQKLAEDLRGLFRKTACFHFRPEVIWRSRISSNEDIQNPHGKECRSVVPSVFKVFALTGDWIAGYWSKIYLSKVQSTFVLYDRSFVDLLVDPKRYRYGGPMGLARWLARFIPKPDLFLFLDLPAEVAHARKPEIPLEEARILRQRYLELARALPNAYVLDASLSPADVADAAEEVIISFLKERTARRLGLT